MANRGAVALIVFTVIVAACSSTAPTLPSSEVRIGWGDIDAGAGEVVQVANPNDECTPSFMVWYLPSGDGWEPELMGPTSGPYVAFTTDVDRATPADCGAGQWQLLIPELVGETLACDDLNMLCMLVEIQS